MNFSRSFSSFTNWPWACIKYFLVYILFILFKILNKLIFIEKIDLLKFWANNFKTYKRGVSIDKNHPILTDKELSIALPLVRLTDLLSTNQIPLALVSNNFLVNLQEKESTVFKDLFEHSKTLYTFKEMLLITNHNFPEQHVIAIIESIYKASKEKHKSVTFVKKTNLKINYDEVVFQKLKF